MFILNFCENSTVLQTILFIRRIIDIVFIVAPLLLALFLTIDLAKNVLSKDDNDNQKNLKLAIKRIILSIALMFIPLLVKTFMGMIDAYSKVAQCYDNANEAYIDKLYKQEQEFIKQKEEEKEKQHQENAQIVEEERKAAEEARRKAEEDAKKNKNNNDPAQQDSNSNVKYKGKAKRNKTYGSIKILDTINKNDFTDKDKIQSTSNAKIAQSFAVVGNNYVVIHVNSFNSHSHVVVYNKYSNKKVNEMNDNFGHANGAAYNAKTNNIYVTHGALSRSKVHKFSAKNIESKKSTGSSSFSTSRNVSGAGYDDKTGKFYFASGDGIYEYKNGSMKHVATRKSFVFGMSQDFDVYDGIIYDIRINGGNTIDLYKTSGGYLGSYRVSMSGLELESIDYFGEGAKMALLFNHYGNKTNYIYVIDGIMPT